MLVPSIDLMEGKAVQLRQGREKVLEKSEVIGLAKYYSKFGEIAVIDLDSAMNTGKDNEELIREICKQCRYVRVGGGIRTVQKAKRILSYGAKKVIIGTAASEEFLSQLPKNMTMVALDEKEKKIAINGWMQTKDESVEDWVSRFDGLTSGYLYTVVEKEGMLQGCDIESIKKLRGMTELEITAAGGISTIEEIKELENMNVSSQLGMSIYTGKINLVNAFCCCLDFAKDGLKGLIPTIVQDVDTDQVLMLAYSNKESLEKTFKTNLATYYSRSRKELWTKGLTSGNVQNFVTARFDCDRDALLFKVKQKGNACHLSRFSCFENKEFGLTQLYKLLLDRKAEMPEKSFTTKLFKDINFLNSKILEEANEVIDFKNGDDDLQWEVADLTYFVLTLMAKYDVTPQEVLNNLASRTK